MSSPNVSQAPSGNQGSGSKKGNTPGSNKSKNSQNQSQPNIPQNKDPTSSKKSTPKSADPGPGHFRFHNLEGTIFPQNSHGHDGHDPRVGNALWHLNAQPRERPGPLSVDPSNDAPMSLRPAPPQPIPDNEPEDQKFMRELNEKSRPNYPQWDPASPRGQLGSSPSQRGSPQSRRGIQRDSPLGQRESPRGIGRGSSNSRSPGGSQDPAYGNNPFNRIPQAPVSGFGGDHTAAGTFGRGRGAPGGRSQANPPSNSAQSPPDYIPATRGRPHGRHRGGRARGGGRGGRRGCTKNPILPPNFSFDSTKALALLYKYREVQRQGAPKIVAMGVFPGKTAAEIEKAWQERKGRDECEQAHMDIFGS